MIKNYLKIAWRNLRKNKVDSFISIGGLAVGIACCLLLVAFVRFEWSFDEFHEKGDRIYAIYSLNNANTENEFKSTTTPYLLASALESNTPTLEEVIRYRRGGADVKIDDQFITARNMNMAEPAFLQMFSFPLIAGNPETALNQPNSILLTKDKAEQIFGTPQAMGETVILRDEGKEVPFTVTGILQNILDNSSFDFEYLLPFENSLSTFMEGMRDNWFVAGSETYVLLNDKADPAQVEKNLERNLGDAVPQNYLNTGGAKKLYMLPLNDMYLSPEISGHSKKSDPLYGWILACIALVVLAIAAINFMSLTLSRAARRSNEISIRKVVGAGRGELARQFIGEALLTCTLAFVLGLVLAEVAMPWFRNLIDKPVSLGLLNYPVVWAVMAGLLALATLITGGYPAWILARQKAASGFISRTTSGKIPVVVKGIIVVQFALAIAFLSSAFIMVSQMNYISSKDLGFNPENLVDIEMTLTDPEQGEKIFNTFSQEAMQPSSVESVTPVYGTFGHTSYMTSLVTDSLRTSVKVEVIDEHFLETMQANIVAGRDFSAERPSEFKNSVLLNQKAAELFGWENPVGKKIDQTKYETSIDEKQVIGVVENYHFRPLYYQLEPLIFMHRSAEDYGVVQMRTRIAEGRMAQTLDRLEGLWNEINPAEPFKYSFVTDLVAQQYENQRRWKSIIQLASGIAILIACFGLFGLAALAARRRTKEIGIRKVLGATVTNIVGLLSKDFLKLVALGFIIAVPIAWYAMNQWLADFAYKIEIGPGIFLLAGGLALVIALATVSWQSIRAALANPVDSLRSE